VFCFVENCSGTCDYKRIGGKVCLLQRFISTLNMKTCIALLNASQQVTLPQKAINNTIYNPNKLIKEQIFKRVNSLQLRGMSTNLGLRSIAY